MDIWDACKDEARPHPLRGRALRLVESQEMVATTRIVSSLQEQALLEEMLEATKPSLPHSAANKHWLLVTPFRYPPLRHGSRFGARYEPGLFYGSLTLHAVLAESAYYRFVFWYGMETPPAKKLSTQHTLFGADYATDIGLQLQALPFNRHKDALIDPTSYVATQPLGSAMRKAGIEAFEFESARDQQHGINVAIFTPDALAADVPAGMQAWLCETTGEQVLFASKDDRQTHHFGVEDFRVDGSLPHPAV